MLDFWSLAYVTPHVVK